MAKVHWNELDRFENDSNSGYEKFKKKTTDSNKKKFKKSLREKRAESHKQ